VAALVGLSRDRGDVPTNAISEDDWRRYSGDLSRELQRLRVERGLTQEHVAYTAGITRTTYQRFEKNENRPGVPSNPELRTLLAIAAVLGVQLRDLLPSWNPDVTP
jgi:DNA-binding XRE family transcriptional regulator